MYMLVDGGGTLGSECAAAGQRGRDISMGGFMPCERSPGVSSRETGRESRNHLARL